MHRLTTKKGLELIKRFEGFSPKPYLCPAGYLTIGYGHKLQGTEKKYTNTIISPKVAEEILQQDLRCVERAVLRAINISLSDHQFDALVSFTFNLGAAALQRSTLRQKLNYQLYKEAAEEFVKWVYVGGRKVNGLIRRRYAEKNLFLAVELIRL